MNNFIYSQDGLKLTESFEGCKLQAYHGSADRPGIWTIGYGHVHGVSPGMTCTQAQAEEWLQEDIIWAAKAVNRLVTTDLTQEEFDALTDFVFNVGAHAFETSTMLDMINAGDHEGSARQFERWDIANGAHVAGLLRRRVAEEKLFNSGR